ncbi:MAG TPA: hypothetical protein VMR52_09095 [Dehalococcoidia bacterium]|nr:hypothetical protein [Dehalococcoidia bacterium]
MAPTAIDLDGGLQMRAQAGANPFANDYTLMTLSLWWVQRTRPFAQDVQQEVASTMVSLARQVR